MVRTRHLANIIQKNNCQPILPCLLALLCSLFALGAKGQKQEIDYKWFREAMLQRSEGNDAQAVADFGLFLNLYPQQHPPAYYYRGYAHMHRGDYKKALADFQKLQELEPQNLDGPFSAGKACYAMGEYQQAEAFFSRSLEIDPFHVPSINDLGMVRMYLLDFDGAYRLFAKAISLDSTFAMAYNNAGAAIYFNQDIDKPIEKDVIFAQSLFSKAIALRPDLTLALRNRAIMCFLLKDYSGALRDLDRAAYYTPNEPMLHFYRGIIAAEQQQPAKAFDELKKTVALNPGIFIAHEEMGKLHKKMANYGEAIAAFKRAQNISTYQAYKGLMDYRIGLVYALEGNGSAMYNALEKARRKGVFSDYRAYKDLLSTKDLKKYRNDKKMYRFIKKATKGRKENRFARPELQWFRMNG